MELFMIVWFTCQPFTDIDGYKIVKNYEIMSSELIVAETLGKRLQHGFICPSYVPEPKVYKIKEIKGKGRKGK